MENKVPEKREIRTTAEFISFAFEIGYSIAIPIVLLVLLGKIADTYFGTKPLIMIAGLILSLITTSYIVYLKTKKLL